MKKFLQDAIKDAFKRLQAVVIFALKCMVIAFVNSLILILPILLSMWLGFRFLTGWFEAGQSQPSAGRNYTALHDERPATSIAERFRVFSRDLQSWIAVIRQYKK